jgi:hypothetical protein
MQTLRVNSSAALMGTCTIPCRKPLAYLLMRKRMLQIMLGSLGLAVFVTLIWMLAKSNTGSGDEARYRRLRRNARSYARISSLENMLPRTVTGTLQLRELEMSYQHKCAADLQALIDSEYLCGARFTVSNLTANRKQTHNRVADALKGTGYWGASLNLASNQLTVYCRPQHVHHLRQALAQ